MSEYTVAVPLSGEEIVEALAEELRRRLYRDCHLNPALAYMSFEAQLRARVILKDNGREEIIETEIILADRPPNVVRQATGQPIPTLVEDSSGRKEIKNVKYKMSAQQGPGGTQQDPGKQQQNPHPPGTPEHEKHEKERKEREEKEKKERERR